MIELKGDDYIEFIKGLDNLQLMCELIRQSTTYQHLANEGTVTEDDAFRYNMVATEVHNRMK